MKPRHKVYLAGPISGLTFDEAEDWREDVRSDLAGYGVDAYSPLRGKDFLRYAGPLEGSYDVSPLSTDRGIMTRDHFDCQTADLIICNLLFAKQVSIGTCMEIGWAFAYRKPLVLVMETEGNLHDHPMIREAAGYRVTSLTRAVDVTLSVLLSDREYY